MVDALFAKYMFGQLVNSAFSSLGWAGLLAMVGAYVAVVAYLTALTSQGPFAWANPKAAVLSYFQQIFFYFSWLLLLV